ncbi:MAG: regulatory protein GemA [Comamonas sp.]
MTTTTPHPAAAARRAQLIRLIHVGRRDLEQRGQMDEPTYRTLLRTASGGKADSSVAMTVPMLERALDQLKRAGFKVRAKAGSKARPDRVQTPSPEARKVRALWLFLHHLGAVRDPSERALAAYVKRIGKVDDLHWARGVRWDLPEARDRMELIIETLKKWAMRYLPGAIQALLAEAGARHQVHPLNQAQQEAAQRAFNCIRDAEGFDMHWAAWERLAEALGRPIHADLRPVSARKAAQ